MRGVSVLGEKLRKLRQMANLTQEELASMADCSDRLIRKAEGGGPVRLEFLEQIIRALNASGQRVALIDVVASHVMIIRSMMMEFDQHGRNVLKHIGCLAEDVELSFPGDKQIFSFAGKWRGMSRVQVFLDRFFESFQRRKNAMDLTLLESPNQVTARFKEQVCFHGLWLEPLSVSLHFHIKDNFISRIECQYDTLAAYRAISAVLADQSKRTAM